MRNWYFIKLMNLLSLENFMFFLPLKMQVGFNFVSLQCIYSQEISFPTSLKFWALKLPWLTSNWFSVKKKNLSTELQIDDHLSNIALSLYYLNVLRQVLWICSGDHSTSSLSFHQFIMITEEQKMTSGKKSVFMLKSFTHIFVRFLENLNIGKNTFLGIHVQKYSLKFRRKTNFRVVQLFTSDLKENWQELQLLQLYIKFLIFLDKQCPSRLWLKCKYCIMSLILCVICGYVSLYSRHICFVQHISIY